MEPKMDSFVLGLLMGNVVVQAYLTTFDIDTFGRLDFLMDRSLVTWFKPNTFALPIRSIRCIRRLGSHWRCASGLCSREIGATICSSLPLRSCSLG